MRLNQAARAARNENESKEGVGALTISDEIEGMRQEIDRLEGQRNHREKMGD